MRPAPIPPVRLPARRLALLLVIPIAAATTALTCWKWNGAGTSSLTFEQAVEAVTHADSASQAATAAVQLRKCVQQALDAIDCAAAKHPDAMGQLDATRQQIVKAATR